MKTYNANTKAAARLLNAYNRATARDLRDVYTKCSTAKTRAEYECRAAMIDENGEDFRILSYNTFGFSCGWMTADGLRVETPTNSYFVKVA